MNEIKELEDFFDHADPGELFNAGDPEKGRRRRSRARAALIEALVWRRAELEASRGIAWPYEELGKRLSSFEEMAGSRDPSIRREAMLFLALLPFPGQWTWLRKARADFPDDPEITAFFQLERETIQKKIDKRRRKKIRLRNFCQVLKKPRLPVEKGILRIYSIPYVFFAAPDLLRKLGERYFLYVEPAAGVVFRHSYLRIFSLPEDPTLLGLSCPEDSDFVGANPGVLTTRIAHGDFLDPGVDVPLGGEKRFDIVFNGAYDEMKRKRHFTMLDLMDHPGLKTINALFIGQGDENGIETFKREVKKRGLDGRVSVLSNIPRAEVPVWLDRCRIGVHLALHENGCRAVYEFLRSDLPCIISSSMAGQRMDVLNPKTGAAVPDAELPDAIRGALDEREKFRPREWFLEKSGCHNSSRELNEIFKAHFARLGYEWGEDIVPLGSGGANRYITTEDYKRFLPEFRWMFDAFRAEADFPLEITEE